MVRDIVGGNIDWKEDMLVKIGSGMSWFMALRILRMELWSKGLLSVVWVVCIEREKGFKFPWVTTMIKSFLS